MEELKEGAEGAAGETILTSSTTTYSERHPETSTATPPPGERDFKGDGGKGPSERMVVPSFSGCLEDVDGWRGLPDPMGARAIPARPDHPGRQEPLGVLRKPQEVRAERGLHLLQKAAVIQDRALRKFWEQGGGTRNEKGPKKEWNGGKRNFYSANVADLTNIDDGLDATTADEDGEGVPEEVAEELYEAYMTHEMAKQKYRESMRLCGNDAEAMNKQAAADRLQAARSKSFCMRRVSTRPLAQGRLLPAQPAQRQGRGRRHWNDAKRRGPDWEDQGDGPAKRAGPRQGATFLATWYTSHGISTTRASAPSWWA